LINNNLIPENGTVVLCKLDAPVFYGEVYENEDLQDNDLISKPKFNKTLAAISNSIVTSLFNPSNNTLSGEFKLYPNPASTGSN
jgi:hypothetical protein